jgi:hypothetical protein
MGSLCRTFRETSIVAAPCSSTAEAMVDAISDICPIVAPISWMAEPELNELRCTPYGGPLATCDACAGKRAATQLSFQPGAYERIAVLFVDTSGCITLPSVQITFSHLKYPFEKFKKIFVPTNSDILSYRSNSA